MACHWDRLVEGPSQESGDKEVPRPRPLGLTFPEDVQVALLQGKAEVGEVVMQEAPWGREGRRGGAQAPLGPEGGRLGRDG